MAPNDLMGNERVSVLLGIERQLEMLRRTDFARLIPEVGSNLAYAISEPRDAGDVAAVPGRIRNAMGRPVFLKPMFGASSHVASILLESIKHDPSKRCAMNLRYSDEIIAACRSLGLKTVFIDRMLEPAEVVSEEGASVPWVLRKAVEECGCVPDVIYHKGAVGKEAMTLVLGENPVQVTGIALELLKRI
ncbi:MAG: thiamine-phosphate synthase [Candidatus Aenigmarchaeota archaeon]|nr:thiamine-phosphate synthase [Candidatus Aenigmarchaeota archaeon]